MVTAAQLGPPTWRRRASFIHRRLRHVQDEVGPTVRLDATAPDIDGADRLDYEVEDYFGFRWWPVEEIVTTPPGSTRAGCPNCSPASWPATRSTNRSNSGPDPGCRKHERWAQWGHQRRSRTPRWPGTPPGCTPPSATGTTSPPRSAPGCCWRSPRRPPPARSGRNWPRCSASTGRPPRRRPPPCWTGHTRWCRRPPPSGTAPVRTPAALAGWRDGLPRATTGLAADQAGLDAWAGEHTLGLIDRFPLTVSPRVLLALAGALATRISWAAPFDLVPGSALGPDRPTDADADRTVGNWARSQAGRCAPRSTGTGPGSRRPGRPETSPCTPPRRWNATGPGWWCLGRRRPDGPPGRRARRRLRAGRRGGGRGTGPAVAVRPATGGGTARDAARGAGPHLGP